MADLLLKFVVIPFILFTGSVAISAAFFRNTRYGRWSHRTFFENANK